MTTVVTGASGFLGGALVTELVKRQQPVRIVACDEQKARQQFGDAVAISQGDITDAAQVQWAVDGATTLYHLAGRLYHPSIPAELYHLEVGEQFDESADYWCHRVAGRTPASSITATWRTDSRAGLAVRKRGKADCPGSGGDTR